MGVVKNQKKNGVTVDKKEIADRSAKPKDAKAKRKKGVSCLQCIKPMDDGGLEGKYRVEAPELMQDTFMSDSEDEGGEIECPIQQQQQYRYMASEAGTLQRARPLDETVADGHLWPSNNDQKVATMERQPVDVGFLVSFVVDARGGAMKAKRRGGVRVIVPPAACSAPTRVTCRAATRRAPAAAPPPLMEGEALASRLLELQPHGAKFLAPVIIEVPIFTADSGEREIVVLRSDTGDTWQDHYLHSADNHALQEALAREREANGSHGSCLGEGGVRVARVVTCDFPHYLAVVSRVRQEVHAIGPDGGVISSSHIPQVQAQFPPQALTKRIRVGLQAHAAPRRGGPRRAHAAPVVTVEPRRRKFHKAIALTTPLPVNADGAPETSNLRLLCSIMGGQARAVWEDVTGSTPLTITGDCATFTTTVSARFWLMSCQNVGEVTKIATDLYREMLVVPFEARIVVLGKRLDSLEGRLLIMYITDRYAYDTLLQQEHYSEVAHSTSVRLLDGRDVYLEFSGNLVPVTKSGAQPSLKFEAFKDNRLEFPVRVKRQEEDATGRIYFMNDPKAGKGEQSQTPACVLDVSLPQRVAPRAAGSHHDGLAMDQSGFDALKDELSFHYGENGGADLSRSQINGHVDVVANGHTNYEHDETDDVSKPNANGITQHIEGKATFDSDDDKTPINTLEKDKKKQEGGSFLGGLAGKVKNVFSHGDDHRDDSKESTPKPKSKESKDKSPPKAAPKVIKEELLDKVDDMFKDLQQKPPSKHRDNLDEEVYNTKLVIEENDMPLGKLNTEDVYEMYKNMQPVTTPQQEKKSDPFQFYTGCCESRYKKGEKHRHDEHSNLVDRIEQANFAANEKLQESIDKIQREGDLVANNAKNQAEQIEKSAKSIPQELSDSVAVTKNQIQQSLYEHSDNIKKSAKEIADNSKHAVSESTKEIEKTVNNAKEKSVNFTTDAKSKAKNAKKELKEAKQKSKEGKGFFGGIVSNIFGEKDKTEQQLKSKAKDVKESASELIDEAASKKDDVADSILSKKDALKEDIQIAEHIAKENKEALKSTAVNFKHDVEEKIEDAKQFSEKTLDKTDKALDNTAELLSATRKDLEKKAGSDYEKIRQEAELATDEISKSAIDAINAAVDKKSEVYSRLDNGVNSLKESGKKELDDVKTLVSDDISALQQSSVEAYDQVHDSALSSFDKFESSAKDKLRDAKDTWDDVNSSAQDTFADMRDEIHGLESSTQDTLHSFQSSAGNTFDSLEESARDVAGGVQGSLNEAAHKSSEVFGEAKEAFEGFQVTADNKLEEVKKTADDATKHVQEQFLESKDAVERKIDDATESAMKQFENVKSAAGNKIEDASQRLEAGAMSVVKDVESAEKAALDSLGKEADNFTSNLNDLGNSVFGSSGKGFMKDSSNKLLDAEKSQSSPHKKGSGIPKLKKKKK